MVPKHVYLVRSILFDALSVSNPICGINLGLAAGRGCPPEVTAGGDSTKRKWTTPNPRRRTPRASTSFWRRCAPRCFHHRSAKARGIDPRSPIREGICVYAPGRARLRVGVGSCALILQRLMWRGPQMRGGSKRPPTASKPSPATQQRSGPV